MSSGTPSDDPKTQSKWSWIARNLWETAQDFFDAMHGHIDDEDDSAAEAARLEQERQRSEQAQREQAEREQAEKERLARARLAKQAELEALAKAIREDECMTLKPADVEDADLQAAKLTEARQAVLTALKDKDTRSQTDIGAATQLLEAVRQAITQAKKNAQDRQAWKSQHDIASPTYAAAKNKLDPAIASQVELWWQSVSDKEAAKDYAKALEGVQAVEQILVQAPLTLAAAEQVRNQHKVAEKSLDTTTADGLKVKLDTAEDLLTQLSELSKGKSDLQAAEAAFKALSKEYKTALKAKATALESADGGHSLDRHGPDVTDDLLKRRVEKGIAADGVLSPTHTSTKFDKVEDWLATRDAAITKILADNSVTASTPVTAGTSYSGVIEHGRPIDSGFVADKSTATDVVMTDTSGQPIYEKKKGKLRWLRNSSGQPLDKNGDVVDSVPGSSGTREPKDKDGNPVEADDHASAVWPTGTEPPVLKVKTFKAYTGHVQVSGLTRTLTTIEFDGTNWKVVQHFPHAEGWDHSQGKYTTPL